MKNNLTKLLVAVSLSVAVCAFQPNAEAVSITVDTILADNPADLSASVDMVLSGSVLTITLRNTSTGGASGAGGLLSGLAFAMPGSISIASGTAYVPLTGPLASSVVNNVNAVPIVGGGQYGDVSGEWGYANAVGGHFSGLAVNRQVSTMQADTSTRFSNTPIDKPLVLDGPEYGLMRTGGDAGGNAAIMDTLVITLNLGREPNNAQGLLSSIEAGTVAVTFGSPTVGGGPPGVPDGGMTLVLCGAGLVAVAMVGRSRKKAA
jgi:hypothetical protein